MATERAVFSEEKNVRGIPKAPFIDDVVQYLGGDDADIEAPLKRFSDALAKYRYLESSLTQRRRGLDVKIPDIRKTLSTVKYLQQRREGKGKASEDDDSDLEDDLDDEDDSSSSKALKTTFELNDTLYAEAELEDTDVVYIWLGANVMLSYKIPEAVELLEDKLKVAETSMSNAVEDLEFLREQITVMEVNTARIYNWDVKRRRERRLKDEGKS